MARLDDVVRFYALLDELDSRLGGPRRLADCTSKSGWPAKGVYFFFESGEERSTSGTGPRVVRVGTHALISTARTSLWEGCASIGDSLSGPVRGFAVRRAGRSRSGYYVARDSSR